MKKIVVWLALLLVVGATKSIFSQNAEMDALLEMGIEELLQTEVVSAAKVSQQLSHVAASMQVVTAKDIHDRGYQSLQELLSDLPGFQFRDIQGFNSYIFQRAIPNQNNLTLLMIDGVLANELNSGGFYGGMHYNLENIEQVEIIYGPSSALYGTNAVTGVINLITKKAKDNEGFNLGASYGSFNTYKLSAGFGACNKEKTSGIRLAARYLSTEKTPLGGADGDYNWTEDIENFERGLAFDASGNVGKLSFGVNVLNKQASIATKYNSVSSGFSDQGTLWNILFGNMAVRYQFDYKRYKFLPQLYYRNSTVLKNTIAEIRDENQVGYYRPGHLMGVDLLNQFKVVDKLLVTGGFILEQEALAGDFSKDTVAISEGKPSPARPHMSKNMLFSLYAQADYTLNRYLNVVAGFRYDNSDYYGEKFVPRLSLTFQRGAWSSSLLYNEAYRAPRPWDFTNGSGNPQLSPEIIQSVEWSNNLKINHIAYFNFALHQSNMQNILAWQDDGNGSHRWVNLDEVKVQGIEAGLKFQTKRLNGYANYTYSNARDKDAKRMKEISPHTANAGVHYQWNDRFFSALRLNFVSARDNASTGLVADGAGFSMRYAMVNAYTILHACFGFKFSKSVEALLFVNNLLNARYYHTSNLQPDHFRQAERSVRLEMNIKL